MDITAEQKKILIVMAVLGVLILGASLWYWWMIGSASVIDAQKQTKTALAQKKDVDQKLQDFETFKKDVEDSGKWAELQDRLRILEGRLPKTEEAFGFIEALDEILRKTSISNERLEKGKISPEVRYTEIPYSIKAVGRYHEFGQFLNLVESNDKRFMRVKNFKISNDKKRPSLHPIEVEIATYSFASHD